MRKSFTIIFLCCFGSVAFGQVTDKNKFKDQVTLRCYYLFNKKKQGAEKTYRSDTMVLDIGSKMSRFYDPVRLGRDSIIRSYVKDENAIKVMHIYSANDGVDISKMPGTTMSNNSEGESYQIFKNTKNSKLEVFDYTVPISYNYHYDDEIGKLPWEILTDTIRLQSYLCQKAIVNFRGRDYAAWFTTEVPVSEGPWKFSGLPGLILKVEDSQHLFSFDLIGLIQPSVPLAISSDDRKSIKCTRAEFEKLKKKQSLGAHYNFTDGDLTIVNLSGKMEYSQMETE